MSSVPAEPSEKLTANFRSPKYRADNKLIIMISPLNSFERLKILSSPPVIKQFFTMLKTPFLDNRCSSFGQLSLHDLSCLNTDLRDETLIFDMHMGRRMIVVPHANNHAKKDRENRHVVQAPYCLATQSR